MVLFAAAFDVPLLCVHYSVASVTSIVVVVLILFHQLQHFNCFVPSFALHKVIKNVNECLRVNVESQHHG